ncbi:MAG: hypothetical protein ACRYGR_09940 [Janthinobacterium lividum]
MLYPDKIVAPLVAGSKARIVAVLADGETTTDFLRTAVDTEIHRRERAMKRKKEDGA